MAPNPERGRARIDWAATRMPLLNRLQTAFRDERPFAGKRIAMSIHLEAKTACLAILLRDSGADVWVTGRIGSPSTRGTAPPRRSTRRTSRARWPVTRT